MKPDKLTLVIQCDGNECTSHGDAIFIGSGQTATNFLSVSGLPSKAVAFQAVVGCWRLRVMDSAVSVEGIDARQVLPEGASNLVLCYEGRRVPIKIQVGRGQAGKKIPQSPTPQPRPAHPARLQPEPLVLSNIESDAPQLPRKNAIVIGSASDCDIVLKDPTVEAHHARLSRIANGGWTIRRLDPGALIWLDGRPILRAGLVENSLLTFGGHSVLWPDDFVAATAVATASSTAAHTFNIVRADTFDRSHAAPAAEFSRVVVGFADVERPHLGPVNQVIEAGKVYAVIGPSGIGKSTFCRALLGEVQLREGDIKIAGNSVQKNVSPNPMHVSFVPQVNILIPQLTVGETLEFAAWVRLASSLTSKERTEHVARVARQLEIEHTMEQRVSSLSGGEQRRVSIAQELLTKPKLLLLDEPTSGLDEGLDRAFMHLVRDLSRSGDRPGIVVVTHATQHLNKADGIIAIGSGRGDNDPVSTVRYSGSPQRLFGYNGHRGAADFMDSLRGRRDKLRPKQVSRTKYRRFVSRPSFAQLRALNWRDRKAGAIDRLKQVLTALTWAVTIAFLVGIIDKDGLHVDGPGSNPRLLVSISLVVILSSLWALYLPITATVSRLPVAHREQRWGVSIRLAILVRALRDSVKVVVQMLLITGFMISASWLVTEGSGIPAVTKQFWIAMILVANGLACYAIGLFIGATSVHQGLAISKMMAVVAVMIVLAGVIFHLPDIAALDIASRVVPPRVAIANTASVLDFGDTMPAEPIPNGPKLDPFMDLSDRWHSLLVIQLFATYFLGVLLAVASSHRTLRQFEARN